MNLLVTGATGFIGPYLIRELTSRGHQCRCLVRNPEASPLARMPNVVTVKGDITQPASLKGIAEGMDGLLHLATLGHMSNYTVSPQMFEAVNVTGTQNIMKEALAGGVARIVHCSSVAAMGICTDHPATETSPCNPHHPYGKSKLAAEKVVLQMVRTDGLPAVIIRFSMVYGPGDRRDILKLTRLAKKGLFPKIGNRPKLTPLIHVTDAVQGIVSAMEKGRVGEIYLITNTRSEPFDKIREILQNAMGIRRFPIYLPECVALWVATVLEKAFSAVGKAPPVSRKNMESTLADRVFSTDKAQTELGFAPSIDTESGLRETVAWYIQNKWI